MIVKVKYNNGFAPHSRVAGLFHKLIIFIAHMTDANLTTEVNFYVM